MQKDFPVSLLSENEAIKPGAGIVNQPNEIFIESYGVKIRLDANCAEAMSEIKTILERALPDCFKFVQALSGIKHHFKLFFGKQGDVLYKNEKEVPSDHSRVDVLRGFETELRLTVAEYAVGRVFVHAGVVGWKGKAIVIPGNSFSGKTSLVTELIKRGAEYYSDEYAVFDADGYLHPFPKTLSIRGEIDEYTQKEYPIEAFGGKFGKKKIPVGMILITRFEADADWQPELLSTGQGVLEMLSHAVPIRYEPKFCLKVLNQAAKRAIIAKTLRGDVVQSAESVLDFFESKCIKV